jgi:hypothetical protein
MTRYWTVEEAAGYLPRAKALLAIARRGVEVARQAPTNGHGGAPSLLVGSTATLAESSDLPRVDLAGPAEALACIESEGVIVRDPGKGLLDFPCRHPGGRVVLLCWREGEEELGWWHLPEAGFAGRRPLPLPPEL